jgi:VanZ family protein
MKINARQVWLVVGIGIIVLLWVLSLMPAPPTTGIANEDKVGHLMMYGGTMWWWGQYWVKRGQRITLALVFTLMGVLVEYVQGWSGWRTFDPEDMVANGIGVALGWITLYTPLGTLLTRLTGKTSTSDRAPSRLPP